MAGEKGYTRFGGDLGDIGLEIAVPQCTGCKYYCYRKGHDKPHACMSGKDWSAAGKLCDGKWPDDCEVFEAAKSKKSKRDSGSSSGKKRPLLVRILCFPCCCIWHCGGGRDPSGGCKKACTW